MKNGKERLILKLKIYNWILDDLGYNSEVCDSIIDTLESLKNRPLELNQDFLYGIDELDKCVKAISKLENKRVLYKIVFNFLQYYIDHICFLQHGMVDGDFEFLYDKKDSKNFLLDSKGIYETFMIRHINMCKHLMNLISSRYPECIKKEPTIEGTEVLSLDLIKSASIIELIDNYIKLINYKIDTTHDILYNEQLSEQEFENSKLELAKINKLIHQVYEHILKNILQDEKVLKKVMDYFKYK